MKILDDGSIEMRIYRSMSVNAVLDELKKMRQVVGNCAWMCLPEDKGSYLECHINLRVTDGTFVQMMAAESRKETVRRICAYIGRNDLVPEVAGLLLTGMPSAPPKPAPPKSAQSKLTDRTSFWSGAKIMLRSLVSNRFACARFDWDDAPVMCSSENKDAWETFTVVLMPDGWAALRSFSGKYLSVRMDLDRSYPPVCASAPVADDWEKFRIYQGSNGIYIKAKCNGKWLCCLADRDGYPLNACANAPDEWETFRFSLVDVIR